MECVHHAIPWLRSGSEPVPPEEVESIALRPSTRLLPSGQDKGSSTDLSFNIANILRLLPLSRNVGGTCFWWILALSGSRGEMMMCMI
ncbi:hypothetical protein CEXT_608511 [Caerostris extrusa]|uniref:Uncharacterized protein n=1 Tax=Caerostris extrusa TaxID=172846 RepID=A0AAV4R7J1_CAEEX|nr:hypothetical protein CEXT_608511 [Caerostris extrusa]